MCIAVYYFTYTGGSKDIGSSLTRLCFRQRSIENRLKAFTKFVSVIHNICVVCVLFIVVVIVCAFVDSDVLINVKFIFKYL